MSTIITKVGLEKIAKATVESPLRLRTFAVGDSNTEPNEDMTKLGNERYRGMLNRKYYADSNTLIIECILRATVEITEGFYIRELGIFDEDKDLIVVTSIPEQYRPPTGKDATTEFLFKINIKIQNTEAIEIVVNEQSFVTIDTFTKLLESSLGVEKYFNTDNTYKDQDIITIGVKTYGLAGAIVNISDYPVAFKNCNAVDIGDGTFKIPEIFNGTIRHLPKGNTRELGTFEDDSFKNHAHNLPDIRFGFQVPSLADDVQGGGWGYYFLRNLINMTVYPIANTSGRWITPSGQNPNFFQYMYSSHSLGLNTVEATGEAETRMKNTSGQWYLLLGIAL